MGNAKAKICLLCAFDGTTQCDDCWYNTSPAVERIDDRDDDLEYERERERRDRRLNRAADNWVSWRGDGVLRI